ncbi:MAG: FMN reductase [Comamonas sp.]
MVSFSTASPSPAPLKVVALAGSSFLPSRTLVLTQALVAALGEQLDIDTHLINLGDIARDLGGALSRDELPAHAEAELQRIEGADLLIAATPVYRGALPGHFKHLFDLIGIDALANKPVILAATGGSDRHALVLDYQLRPLFSFLQAIALPIGVYGSTGDFEDYQISSSHLQARIRLAVERAAPLFPAHRRAVPEAQLKIA